MRQKSLFFGLAALFSLFVASATMTAPINAHADYGPKPTTTVTILGMRSVDSYFVAPLSQSNDGPWRLATSADDFTNGETLTAIDDQLMAFSDPDGFFYTTRRYQECSGNCQVRWTYMPPDPFKALVYIPDIDVFVVSPVLERTTFDTFISLRLSGESYDSLAAGTVVVLTMQQVSNTYRVLPPLLSLFGRIAVTLVLELIVAFFFKYRSKKQVSVIVVTNIVTQLVLNCALILTYIFLGGGLIYWLEFALCEGLVFLGEALFYRWYFRKKAKEDSKNFLPDRAVLYALIANLLSLGFGIIFSIFQNFSYL